MVEDSKKLLKLSILLVFFLAIALYAFLGAKALIFGVKIKNVDLADGARVTESVQKVTGNAKNAVNLTLNGREISIDEDGNFDETIALLPGYNVISIRAVDKFGNIDEKNYQITYEAVETVPQEQQ